MAYTYVLDDPPRVRRNITLYDDGQAWYWATLPGARRGDEAGTYAFSVDAATLALGRGLAQALVSLSVSPATPVFNVIAAAVTTYAGGAERTHQLGFTAAQNLPAPLVRAHELGESLASPAERSPLAVARMACKPGALTIRADDRATVRFAFTNSGTLPVTFLLELQSFRVEAEINGEWQECWRHDTAGHLGLVGPRGDLVDGLILPATLAPGASATAVFLQALQPRMHGRLSLRGQVEGTISLLRRDEAPPDFPQEPFRLVSAPETLTIGDD